MPERSGLPSGVRGTDPAGPGGGGGGVARTAFPLACAGACAFAGKNAHASRHTTPGTRSKDFMGSRRYWLESAEEKPKMRLPSGKVTLLAFAMFLLPSLAM